MLIIKKLVPRWQDIIIEYSVVDFEINNVIYIICSWHCRH